MTPPASPPPMPPADLPRFHCPDLPARGATCLLDDQQTRHARQVLRLREGAVVELFDGRGTLARATLTSVAGREAECTIEDIARHAPPRPTVMVACAIPKGGRADEMVDQLSQLGCDRLLPLRSERSVVDPRPGKLDRFGRRALESAKQCGRLFAMEVEAVRSFGEVLAEPADVRLIAAPGGPTLGDLPDRLAAAGRVLVLIGPEGGWTDAELAAAREAGFDAWSLGPHVLRIETAALAATAVLRCLTLRT